MLRSRLHKSKTIQPLSTTINSTYLEVMMARRITATLGYLILIGTVGSSQLSLVVFHPKVEMATLLLWLDTDCTLLEDGLVKVRLQLTICIS